MRTHGSKRFRVALAACLLGVGAVDDAAAQLAGRVGSACGTLPVTHEQDVTLDAAVAAGSTLLVGVAISSSLASDLVVEDAVGTRYQALGAIHGAHGTVVRFRGLLQRPRAAGDAVRIVFGAGVDGVTQSCTSVIAYRGIPAGTGVQNAVGAASGHSAGPSVVANVASPAVSSFVLATIAFEGVPANPVAQPPASSLPAVCSADQSLCLADVAYDSAGDAVAEVALAMDVPLDWAAALSALDADGIFGNGFD